MTHVHLSLHELSELVILQTQRGKSRDEIVKVLVARGWPQMSAERFVDMTLAEHHELAAQAPAPESGQQPADQASHEDQQMGVMLLVVVLLTLMVILLCNLMLSGG
ncbi:MAG: hypothetical protein M1434_11040 [Chloroflexi bacterium]|nr:hypothetical protein [Chloroflexota bacterium]